MEKLQVQSAKPAEIYIEELLTMAGDELLLTYEQINTALPAEIVDSEIIETVIEALDSSDIEIYDLDEGEASTFEIFRDRLKLVLVKNRFSHEERAWMQNFLISEEDAAFESEEECSAFLAAVSEDFLNHREIKLGRRFFGRVMAVAEELHGEGNHFQISDDIQVKFTFHNLICRAEAGCEEAMVDVGDYVWLDLLNEGNEQSAIYWYQRAAVTGNSEAAKKLGEIFYRDGGGDDFYRASRYFEMAAEEGDEEAKALLALMKARDDYIPVKKQLS